MGSRKTERSRPEAPGTTEAPRAQRFPVAMRVLWRPRGGTGWFEAMSVNTSRSGVLFRPHHPIEVGAQVELLLPMGHEHVASVTAADVLCRGRIVRVTPGSAAGGGPVVAAKIDSYVFLRERDGAPGARPRM